MVRARSADAVADDNGEMQAVWANKHGCKARCCGRQSCSNCCHLRCAGTLTVPPTQRPVDENQAGLDAAAPSSACMCECSVRHRGSLTMRIAPSECGFGAEDIGHVCCEQAGCGMAASGQQRSLRCSCDLAGAVSASSLAALEAARQAWKVLNGGWTAMCSWPGPCWPCWPSGEDLSQLHATDSKCGCRFACSDACTVCPRVVTPLTSAENDVHSCKTGQPIAILTASASLSQEKKTDNTPKVDTTSSVQQPHFRPQPLPPPRLEGEGSASAGCKRRTQALKPNRAHRRGAQRRRQQYARLAASLSARRKVPVGAARVALVERLAALPPLARRRRVAMWRRRWRRDRRMRRDGPGAGGVKVGLVERLAEAGIVEQPTAWEQTRPKTFWDKVWAVPMRIWNALMRAY